MKPASGSSGRAAPASGPSRVMYGTKNLADRAAMSDLDQPSAPRIECVPVVNVFPISVLLMTPIVIRCTVVRARETLDVAASAPTRRPPCRRIASSSRFRAQVGDTRGVSCSYGDRTAYVCEQRRPPVLS